MITKKIRNIFRSLPKFEEPNENDKMKKSKFEPIQFLKKLFGKREIPVN